jgi:hypothetical protein
MIGFIVIFGIAVFISCSSFVIGYKLGFKNGGDTVYLDGYRIAKPGSNATVTIETGDEAKR